MKWTRVSKSN